MIGEISIGGVYVPALLIFVAVGLILTGLLSRLLSLAGFYRLVMYRPLIDLALFALLLAAIVWLTRGWGLRS